MKTLLYYHKYRQESGTKSEEWDELFVLIAKINKDPVIYKEVMQTELRNCWQKGYWRETEIYE